MVRRITLLLSIPTLVIFFYFFRASYADAAMIMVTTPIDEYTTNGDCSLREAIISANTNSNAHEPGCIAGEMLPLIDSILVPSGPYVLTIPGTGEDFCLTGDLDIIEDVEIHGQYPTWIDADYLDRIFDIKTPGISVLLDSLIMLNGIASPGGAIYVQDSALAMMYSEIDTSYSPGNGGAIYLQDGYLDLSACSLYSNSADSSGGGIYATGSSNIGLSNTTVSTNSAATGGGLYNSGTTSANITHTTFYENSASSAGSTLYHASGSIDIDRSVTNSDCYIAGTYSSLGYNVETYDSCGFTNTSTGDVQWAYLFLGEFTDNGGPTGTHAIMDRDNSVDRIPLVDCTLLDDQRQAARPSGTGCDSGAFELQWIEVDTTADELTDNDQCSLREAIRFANLTPSTDDCWGDEMYGNSVIIDLPAGTYTMTRSGRSEDNCVTGDYDVKSMIYIEGEEGTIVDANSLDRAFQVHPGQTLLSLRNLTVRNGMPDMFEYGAGIDIYNNSSGDPNSPTLLIINTVIEDCITGAYGGGISSFSWDAETLPYILISNSTIQNNNAIFGGGIHTKSAHLEINNSLFYNNGSSNAGGIRAMRMDGAPDKGSLSIYNSTFAENSTTDTGGGVFASGMPVYIYSSTFKDNTAHEGDLGEDININYAESLYLHGNLFADDCVVESTPYDPNSGYNVEKGNTCLGGMTGDLSNQSDLDSHMGILQDNGGPTLTYAIDAQNTALNHIPTIECVGSTDQRGEERPSGSGCDAGAFELQLEDLCLSGGGSWIPEYDECVNLDQITCESVAGIYDSCASSCRHSFNPGMCVQDCTELCTFGGGRGGTLGIEAEKRTPGADHTLPSSIKGKLDQINDVMTDDIVSQIITSAAASEMVPDSIGSQLPQITSDLVSESPETSYREKNPEPAVPNPPEVQCTRTAIRKRKDD